MIKETPVNTFVQNPCKKMYIQFLLKNIKQELRIEVLSGRDLGVSGIKVVVKAFEGECRKK